jgi:hypothetical protein
LTYLTLPYLTYLTYIRPSLKVNTKADKLLYVCRTGYANHGDYLFGWKGDALQRALDSPCYQNCPTLTTQNAGAMNKCSVLRVVKEDIDGWVGELPGGHQAQYVQRRRAD